MSRFVAIVFSQWYVRLPSHKEWHQHVDQLKSFWSEADAAEYLCGLGFEVREDQPRRFAPRLDHQFFTENLELGEFDFAVIREGQAVDVQVLPPKPPIDEYEKDLIEADRWSEQYRLDKLADMPKPKRRRCKPEHRTWV
ncbi:hypothetical protein KKG19_00245 [Patescibacteria group bacterium]|nr:hypothetical protein [Patescibacteria group bacterium]